MQTQKIFTPRGQTLVVCDYREQEVAQQLARLGARINKTNLEVADFVCSGNVAVERKAHSDFVSSIIDGRLFEQAKLLTENYKKPVLIIEGYSDRNINPNALYAAMATLMQSGISLMWTKNPSDTARAVYWIAKKEQSDRIMLNMDIGIKVGKKHKELKKLQEFVIASVPGVSAKLSKRLLEKFGSVEAVFAADESKLQTVDGVGKKLAKKIKDIASEEYK